MTEQEQRQLRKMFRSILKEELEVIREEFDLLRQCLDELDVNNNLREPEDDDDDDDDGDGIYVDKDLLEELRKELDKAKRTKKGSTFFIAGERGKKCAGSYEYKLASTGARVYAPSAPGSGVVARRANGYYAQPNLAVKTLREHYEWYKDGCPTERPCDYFDRDTGKKLKFD